MIKGNINEKKNDKEKDPLFIDLNKSKKVI